MLGLICFACGIITSSIAESKKRVNITKVPEYYNDTLKSYSIKRKICDEYFKFTCLHKGMGDSALILPKIEGNYKDELKMVAPFGFVSYYSFSANPLMHTGVYIQYTNISDKTIKYLDIYIETFDVNNKMLSQGIFRCDGPIKEWETYDGGLEEFTKYLDYSYSAIAKIVITYIDETSVVLRQDDIICIESNFAII